MCAGDSIPILPSADIWAAAVISYEVLTHGPALETLDDALACAKGEQSYPWHGESAAQPAPWRGSRLAELLLPCLRRDASRRPSATAVKGAVSQLV